MKVLQSLILPYALYCRVIQRLPLHSRVDYRLLATTSNIKKAIAARIPVVLNDDDIEESFIKGSGPGGQKVNKRSNRVRLVHKPTGATVSCQDFRDLTSNRKHARTMLRDKIDVIVNGGISKLEMKFEKIRKRKAKSAKRSAKKYGSGDSDIKADTDTDKKDGPVDDKKNEPIEHSDNDDDDDDDEDEEEEEPHRDREQDPGRKNYYHQGPPV